MRAAVLRAFGTDPEVTDIETPVAGAGQVLVAVEASGVDPLDTKIRAGKAGHAREVVVDISFTS
jgi:NADPH2:quinone reductase